MEAWQELAIGLICMVVLGPAVGNYATSVVFRLPRNQTPFEKHPYCGNCNTFLKPEDLFPIWSYVLLGGKCRYCAFKIPAIYTWVEVACGALFVGNYLAYGITEPFILLTSLGVFGVILAALEWQQGKIYALIFSYVAAIALIWRAVVDGSIYPAFLTASVMLVLAAALWRLLCLVALSSRHQPPAWMWMAVLAGLLFPLKLALGLMAGIAAAALLCRLFTRNSLWSALTLAGIFGVLWLGVA